jgi:hypothetical protein
MQPPGIREDRAGQQHTFDANGHLQIGQWTLAANGILRSDYYDMMFQKIALDSYLAETLSYATENSRIKNPHRTQV